MDFSSWTEEDFKNKLVIPFFKHRDFDVLDMEFEKPLKITVGTKRITVHSDIVVKIKGLPFMVIEVKKPSHKISGTDIDQAISYARLSESIVPFAMVTNLEETKIYNVFTRTEVDSVQSYEQASKTSQKFSLDKEFKLDALRALFRLNFDFILDFCSMQRKNQTMHLICGEKRAGRFAHQLYLPRKHLDAYFEEFLKSEDHCFALVAEQGTGKTFSMVMLAEKCGAKSPTLFYDSSFIPDSLSQAIEEDFGWGRKQRPWIGDIFTEIDQILKSHKAQMIIFVDAINEPIPSRHRKIDIVNLIRRINGTSIKLCLACRTQDWKFFSMEKGEFSAISWMTFMPREVRADRTLSTYSPELTGLGSCGLTNFSDSEFEQVFPYYSEAFNLKGGLSKEAKDLCKHPETLRLVSEIYSNDAIPVSLRRRRVLERFWLKKVESIGNPQAAEHLLFTIGEIILESKNPEIKEHTLLESTEWNEAYQEVYKQAISENVLLVRKDSVGDKHLRISPNILMEYILARLLLGRSSAACSSDMVEKAKAIIENLRGFPLLGGTLLIYSSLLSNCPDLVLHLMEKIDSERVIDQILDENPEVMEILLTQEAFKIKVLDLLSDETDFYKLIRIILSLLKRVKTKPIELTTELILSEKLQQDLVLLYQLTKFVFERSKYDKEFSDVLDSLFAKMEERGQRVFIDFLYRINYVDAALSKKILAKFEIGALRHLITSDLGSKESGRSLYLLSRINRKKAFAIDPSKRILESFERELKVGKIPSPFPLRGSISKMRIRAELPKAISRERSVRALLENSPLTWEQISSELKTYKYKVLATLESLVMKGIVWRKLTPEKKYLYQLFGESVPLRGPSGKATPGERRSGGSEFTEKVVSSNFDFTTQDIDNLIEEKMLGRYLNNWESTRDFCFDVFSCSIDVNSRLERNSLELPGKTFRFLITWLNQSGGLRKYVAKNVISEMSRTASKMFKNMIFGIRARQRAKGKPVEIRNLDEFERRMSEFSKLFGELGVRLPTKQEVFEQCLSSLKEITDGDDYIIDPHTIEVINRLADIFNEKLSELQPILKRVKNNINEPYPGLNAESKSKSLGCSD